MARINGFRVLAEITIKSKEPALVSQVMHLYYSYLDHLHLSKTTLMITLGNSVTNGITAPLHRYKTHGINEYIVGGGNSNNLPSILNYSSDLSTPLLSSSSTHANISKHNNNSSTGNTPATTTSLSSSFQHNYISLYQLHHQQQKRFHQYHQQHNHHYSPRNNNSAAALLQPTMMMHNKHINCNNNHSNYVSSDQLSIFEGDDAQFDDTASIAAKGFTLAFNFVSELLK